MMKKWAVWAFVGLVVMLALPVVVLLVMEKRLQSRCHTEVKQTGTLGKLVEWRISEAKCEGGQSYHDVEIGPTGRALTSAFTSRRAVPIDVIKIEDGVAGIVLDGEKEPVRVKLRTSGSAAQRIDYDGKTSP